tara:strand:+ start:629 stop:1168 length:540 start_codon:yes stop_codon:yes gene_type:complete
MKITKERLKKIIAEELNEMERVPVPRDDPFGRDQTKEIKSHLRALKKIFDEVGLKNVPDEMKRGLSKIRTALDDIPGLKEELEEMYRPSTYRRRSGEEPHTPMDPDVMKRGGEDTDVYGKPLRQQTVMSDEPPVENLEADAEQIIRLLSMGLVNTTKIMNPELKALVLNMRPDLARRIV